MSQFFAINHNADTTETGLCMNRTYVRCDWAGHDAQRNVMLVLEGWCEERFGSRVAYVQGVAPCPNWSIHEIDEEAWREAKPIRWGGMNTKTIRLALALGNKSGLDKSHAKVLWEQPSSHRPISEDSTICPKCGHVFS